MKIHNISIDLSKIDKSRIKEHPNGGKYYELTIIENEQPNQWGHTLSVCTAQTKEEREAKMQRSYCGSGKTVFSTPATPPPSPHTDNTASDLPF